MPCAPLLLCLHQWNIKVPGTLPEAFFFLTRFYFPTAWTVSAPCVRLKAFHEQYY